MSENAPVRPELASTASPMSAGMPLERHTLMLQQYERATF